MKKCFLFLAAIVTGMSLSAQEEHAVRVPSGYQGFLEQGPGFRVFDDMKSSVSFSTTHGFYFNSNTYIGIGCALEGGNGFFAMPFYTALKYNFTYRTKVTPTVQLRLGSYLANTTGAYGDLAVGLRFGSARDFAINIMLAGSFLSNYEEVEEGIWNSETKRYDQVTKEVQPTTISLRIGIEW